MLAYDPYDPFAEFGVSDSRSDSTPSIWDSVQGTLGNVLNTGIVTLGAAGINQGLSGINGYPTTSLYPFQYGATGYNGAYGLTTQKPGLSIGMLVVIGVLVWMILRKK